MKFDYKKYLPLMIKISGYMMSFAFVVVTVAQQSTCFAFYHQPKCPESLLETDED